MVVADSTDDQFVVAASVISMDGKSVTNHALAINVDELLHCIISQIMTYQKLVCARPAKWNYSTVSHLCCNII